MPIVPYAQRRRDAIAFISAQQAKGLDARAVVLVDFPSVDQLNGKLILNYFMGASRARLMLGIVHTS